MDNKILLGLRDLDETLLKGLKDAFNADGINQEFVKAQTKLSVKRLSEMDEEISTVIIQQGLESIHPYTADEIIYLHELRDDINIIILVQDGCYNSDFLYTLYSAGVYGAVFEKDAALEAIAGLAKNGRLRKLAKIYYGLDEKAVSRNQGQGEEFIDPERIKANVSYIMKGSDGSFEERVSYVHGMLTGKEFAHILTYLPEDALEKIKLSDEYQIYFPKDTAGAENSPKKIIELPNLSFNFGKTKVVTERRRIIGVFGCTDEEAAGYLTEGIARIAAEKSSGITVMEVPGSREGGIFGQLSLTEKISRYYSVPHQITKGSLNMAEGYKNIYKGITYMVEDTTLETIGEWNYEHSYKMLYATDDTIVISLRASLRNVIQQGIINHLTDVFIAVDVELVGTEHIKDAMKLFRDNGINPVVILYGTENKKQDDEIYYGHEVIKMTCHKMTRQKGEFQPEVLAHPGQKEKHQVLEALGMSDAGAGRPRKRNVIVDTIGCIEIAVMGVSQGSGCTHTAILCANHAKHEEVCIIEQNTSGHFERLCRELDCETDGTIFTIDGIDFYYNVSYSEFSIKYKSAYKYILIDYGAVGRINGARINDMARCNKKIICAHCVEWKLDELRSCSGFLETHDPRHEYDIFVPFIDERDIKHFRMSAGCGDRRIYRVPVNLNPFTGDDECRRIFRRYLSIHDKKKKFKFLK